MDFDEYDYLEKTVEKPDLPKEEEPLANGALSDDREHSRGPKRRSRELERDSERPYRHARTEEDGAARDHDRHRGRMSSRLLSSPEHPSGDHERGERDGHRSGSGHRGRDREERSWRDHRERDKERGRDRERDRETIKERDREMERGRERSRRSRSRSERPRDEERDRYRERSKDREFIAREGDTRERERDGRCARAIFRWSFWKLILIRTLVMGIKFNHF